MTPVVLAPASVAPLGGHDCPVDLTVVISRSRPTHVTVFLGWADRSCGVLVVSPEALRRYCAELTTDVPVFVVRGTRVVASRASVLAGPK